MAEQPREFDECIAETGKRPVELLEERFVAVQSTHLSPAPSYGHTFAPRAARTPAEELWRAGSLEGALACGFSDAGGTVRIPREHPALDLVEDELLLDAIVFGGSSAMIEAIDGGDDCMTAGRG